MSKHPNVFCTGAIHSQYSVWWSVKHYWLLAKEMINIRSSRTTKSRKKILKFNIMRLLTALEIIEMSPFGYSVRLAGGLMIVMVAINNG